MNRKAFTLLELLIVILIIAIITTLAMPQYQLMVERSIATEAIGMLGILRRDAEAMLQYGTPISDSPMVVRETKHWTYPPAVAQYEPGGSTAAIFGFAVRKNGAYMGTYISITCYADGTFAWSGDHVGVPRG